MVLGKLDSNIQQNENGLFSCTMHKNKTKLGLKTVSPEIIKILEENKGSNFFGINHSNIFLGFDTTCSFGHSLKMR